MAFTSENARELGARGGNKRKKANPRNARITVCVSENERSMIHAKAQEFKMSVTSLIVEAVAKYTKQE